MTTESDDLRFLPVALRIRNRGCLVVGGGAVGTRKVFMLLRAGGSVTVVSPAVTNELSFQIQGGGVQWRQRDFERDDLRDAFLVVAATDNDSVNAEIVRLAEDRGLLACDASSSDRSQLIFGAIHQEEGATVAVFTDGRDPARARKTRDRIAKLMSAEENAG